MKTFHNLKCKAYPHERLDTSKGVIRNRDLSIATPEEMTTALGKQAFTDSKRITTRKGGEEIQTHTLILIFNKLIIPNEMKIEYSFKRVEQYTLIP